MSFTISCSNCNSELEAEDEMIGRALNCPNCNNTIKVKKAVKAKGNRKARSGTGMNKVKYPTICKVAGIVLLVLSVGALLHLFKLNWNKANQVHMIALAQFVLFLSSGFSLMLKKKMGVIGSYVILTLYGLTLVIFFGMFKFKELNFEVIALTVLLGLVSVLLIFSAFSFNKWQEEMKPRSRRTSN